MDKFSSQKSKLSKLEKAFLLLVFIPIEASSPAPLNQVNALILILSCLLECGCSLSLAFWGTWSENKKGI